MTKEKYLIDAGHKVFTSNSRNARKHLFEQNVMYVDVYLNDDNNTLVCKAFRTFDGIIVSGAMKRG